MVVIEDILIKASDELKPLIDHELYIGTEAMVAKKLKDIDPADRYPLIAIVTGFNEYSSPSGYIEFTIQRIVFGTLANVTDTPLKRISDTGTFKTILYPLYEGYLKQLCKQPGIGVREFQTIPYIKNNLYGEVPATDKVSDVLDAIEIKNFTNKIAPQRVCG